MIKISENIFIDRSYIKEDFVRASGPGGQNVNKVSTAVQLRFNLSACPTIPAAVKSRLRRIAGKKLSEEGIIIIDARRYRTRERNRIDARERLKSLIRKAARTPARRLPTRPTMASINRRLRDKEQRKKIKLSRKQVSDWD